MNLLLQSVFFVHSCSQLSAFTLNTAPEVWPDAIAGSIDTFQQVNSTGLDVSFLIILW